MAINPPVRDPPMNTRHPEDNDHDLLAYLLQALACVIWTSSYIYTNEHDCDVF